jgi:hypothetical protein
MRTKFTLKEVAEDPALLAKVLAQVRAAGSAEHRFDINLAEGKLTEGNIKKLFSGEEAIEVKRDFKISETGNVAVEFECRGKPSGIAVTKSDWYAIALDGEEFEQEVIIFITTERLKRLVDAAPGRVMYGGDGKLSCFKLLRADRLLLDNTSIEDYEDYVRWQRVESPAKKRYAKV